MAEKVNHPKHYNTNPSGVECIDVVEHYSFNLGNAMKYIWRADEKENPVLDLKKAIWYLEREIKKREKNNPATTAINLDEAQEFYERHSE